MSNLFALSLNVISSIWRICKTLSGATTPDQSGHGSNKGVHCILQISSITWFSPSDCLMSYPKLSLEDSYLSAEMHSVYSKTPANWARKSSSWLICWINRLLLGRSIPTGHTHTPGIVQHPSLVKFYVLKWVNLHIHE